MSHAFTNDPKASLVLEYAAKQAELDALRKAIKTEPDARYIRRKELGKEVQQIKEELCEAMSSDEEVEIGYANKRRCFKKAKKECVRFSKDRVYNFCSTNELSPEMYAKNNTEEVLTLQPV